MSADEELISAFARALAVRLFGNEAEEKFGAVLAAVDDHVDALRPGVVYLVADRAVHALPWRVEEGVQGRRTRIWASDGTWISDMHDEASADLIVRAVNAHLPGEVSP